MKSQYDLKKLKWGPNPYLGRLKTSVTIRFDDDVLFYFRSLSHEEGIPYQTLMNQFLKYCKEKKLKPKSSWVSHGPRRHSRMGTKAAPRRK